MMNVESRIISSLEKVFLSPRFEGAAIEHLSALRGERVHFQIAICTGESAGVTIPDSVTAIGSRAFSGCDNLTNVTIGTKTRYKKSSFPADCKVIRRGDTGF